MLSRTISISLGANLLDAFLKILDLPCCEIDETNVVVGWLGRDEDRFYSS